jgi:hypothetical protein
MIINFFLKSIWEIQHIFAQFLLAGRYYSTNKKGYVKGSISVQKLLNLLNKKSQDHKWARRATHCFQHQEFGKIKEIVYVQATDIIFKQDTQGYW